MGCFEAGHKHLSMQAAFDLGGVGTFEKEFVSNNFIQSESSEEARAWLRM